MNLGNRLLAQIFGLPPAETYAVDVDKNLAITVPDGVVLLADHYYPRNLGPRPTVLMRSTYTDRSKGGWVSRLYAERGFHVLVVSGRGVDGSGGELEPFRRERDDGIAVLAWLKEQPWFTGELGTTGASYLGYTQWAIAADAGSMLKAMSTQLIGSSMRELIYPGGGLALETFAWWMAMVDAQELSLWSYMLRLASSGRRRRAALRRLPLGTLDQALIGTPSRFWRDWLAHEQPGDPWWAPGDHSAGVGGVRAPNHLIGGWYDFFLPSLLRDYRALVEAGRAPYLTVGPWLHTDVAASTTGMREALIWLRAHLLGDRTGLRKLPVRVFVQGANVWRELPVWPPETIRHQRWYLQPRRAVSPAAPPLCEPDGLRYDPRDPTPSIGDFGRFVVRATARRDNGALERRSDVLLYTSAPLERDTELLGPVSAELWIRSSHEHADVFVRLCDVAPSGRSLTICDGLLRLAPGRSEPEADGCRRACIELWPTAYRLRRGHRLRVQIAGGSFPRWNRNLGSAEPLATATIASIVEQSIYHDPQHPSSIVLPIVP